MAQLVEYLFNPMEKGVTYRKYEFDISDIIEAARSLNLDEWVENEENEKEFLELYHDDETFYENLVSIIIEYYSQNLDDNFCSFFNIQKEKFMKKVQDDAAKYGQEENEVISELLWDECDYLFDSELQKHYHDSIVFNEVGREISKSNKLKRIEAISVNTKIVTDFELMISKIPHIKDSFKILKNRVSHSSRFVFRPYHHALRDWLSTPLSSNIHNDLIELITNATDYHEQSEWRTSVILNSIVTELILADIYEEQYQKDAPDVPLGTLFHEVKTNQHMTPEIIEQISELNKIRISAVHRSKSPISERDSEIVMKNIYALVNWYSDCF